MGVWSLLKSEEPKHAIAICSFKHENHQTLAFKIGDRLELREQCDDWYRGFLVKNPNKLGIFPKSFVRTYDPKKLNYSDPAVSETESILREWTSIWSEKYEECEKKKKTHCLMGYFKNVLNLKNVIVENRASIDEIKELKKSTISKILQGNSILGLDVIAFDTNYNKLDPFETTTIVLFEELKKNSEYKNQTTVNHHHHQGNQATTTATTTTPGSTASALFSSAGIDGSLSDTNLLHFYHKSSAGTSLFPVTGANSAAVASRQSTSASSSGATTITVSRSSMSFCLQVSLFNLVPSPNCAPFSDEHCDLCVNLFLYKESSPENSYYLCENAYFDMSSIYSSSSSSTSHHSTSSLKSMSNNNTGTLKATNGGGGSELNGSFSISNGMGNLALFCDMSEKDFELTKNGYKLFLVVYAIRHTKPSATDRHAAISRCFAGGVYDLGSNLCNIVYVTADVRNIQSSMCMTMADFESSIVQPKTLHELVKEKDANESLKSGGKSTSKDSYLTLTFKTELSELSFKNAVEKYSHVRPKVLCRKMDFPEIIMPDDFRNDFYVTVLSGEFQKARNYEFVVNLVQFRGGITTSSNEVPVDFSSDENNKQQQQFFFYKSLVYAKQERPKWNEIVNVSIPHGKKAEEIKKTYLRFLIRNRSLDGKDKTKLVGVAYLQITNEDGSAIKDARCHLPVVKLDSDSEMGSFDGYFYPIKTQINLSKIAGFQSPSSAAANAEKYKDFIDVKVKVVSTQLTQNVTLLNLLSFPTEIKPETDRYESLLTYLDELLSVKDEQSAEIVKFLQAILDKLIDILLDLKTKQQQQQSNGKDETAAYEMHAKQIQPRVFEILVAIFQIIENQSKFASFRTVIDAYLSKNFCITLAHKPLLRIFSDTMTAICDKYTAYNQSTTTTNTPQITNGMNGSGGSNSNLFMAPAPIYPSKSNGSYQHRHSEYTTPNGSAPNGSSHEEKENENAINTIKSMEYIFKFAFRSRELLSLYNRGANNPQSDLKSDSFDNDIAAIFSKLKEITELTVKHSNNVFDSSSHSSFEANLTKIQSFILKNLINLMPILINSKRYSMSKISEFYIGFLNSRYVLQTQFLSKLIRSKLFESQEGRRVLIEPLCRSITNLISIDNRNEDKAKIDAKLESVGKVFAELMDVLEKKNIGNISQDMNEICRMLLKFSNIFLYFKNSQENRQLYGSILISIMRLMDASHYETFFDCLGGFAQQKSIDQYLEENRSFIDENIISGIVNLKGMSYEDSVSQLVVIQAIYSCVTLLDENTFPKDWFDLLILRNSVILNAMYHIADRINRYHLEVFNKTNKQIWFDYFDCLVKLATDTCLQLEKFNESKRNNIISRYKDMRIKVAIEIKKMWYNLGDKKHHFIQHMVEPFLKVALIPSGEIHNALIPVFFDMINCEHLLRGSGDFESHSVPRELITNVDILVSLGYGDSKFRDAFERILVEKFNLHINLKANVDFVKKFVELFDLLVEYRDLKEDSSEQLKTFYLNEILNFYGNMRRWDIYVKYVEILRKIHKACKNAVCAANTLKLHAELLYWSNEPLEEYLRHPSYPNESVHKTLKERLFIDMINDYTEGQAWEKAFELSKILRGIYDSEYELEKLYKFLRKQADLCENIIKVERYECKFYLVGFYGRGFPRLLQNKRFIFMSEPLEQIMTFRQRVESWFPNSTRILHSNPLSSVEQNSDAQFIQIISVQPVYEEKAKLKGLALSPQVLKYYLHNEVSKFKYTFRKDTKLNEDDPTLWWLKENILTTSTQLPDVINFYPVISENAVDISPIQNAINTVRERLEKLKATYAKIEYSREVGETDKSLIQGTIDAGVLGGLPKYKKFYAPSFAETNPENTAQVEELKTLIIETINWGESFLDLALEYLPNDDLLSILKQEQLPKLKSLFDMPLQPTMRRQRNQVTNGNSQSQLPIDSTPKSSKQSFSLNESTSSSRSFLKQITQVENYPGRSLMSYIGGGSSSKNAAASSSNQFLVSSSNRDSIASIKSLNSDDENSGFLIGVTTTPSASNHSGSRSKIVLDETVNPKRPLRPGRGGSGVVVGGGGPVVVMPGSPAGPGSAQNSTSSPSTSAHSSRPMSHLSHSGVGTSSLANVVLAQNAADSSAGSQLLNSVSMQQILLNTSLNSASSSSRRHTHDDLAEAVDLLILGGEEMPPPPPKPPKTATLKFNKLSTANSTNSSSSSSSSKTNNQVNSNDAGNIGSQSSDDLINVSNQQHNNAAAKSSNSLNSASLQFRYLGQKTTSDSILNRLPEDPTKMS